MHEKKCEGNIHTHTDTQKSEKFTSSLIKLVSNIFTDRVKKKKKKKRIVSSPESEKLCIPQGNP